MKYHPFIFALMTGCILGLSVYQSAHAQTLATSQTSNNETDDTDATYVDTDMWKGLKLNKDVQDLKISKADAFWEKQTSQIQKNTSQFSTQSETSFQIIDAAPVTNLPSGFTGSPSELNEIRKQFSSYKPKSTYLKPGKIYLRKDLQKTEKWKPSLETDK